MISFIKKIDGFLEGNRFTGFFVNRDNFALVYTISAMLYSVPMLIDKTDILSKIVFLWGIALIGWDIICKRCVFRTVYWAFPILLLGSYAVSILLNFDSGIYNLIKHFIYTSITLLLLYGRNRKATKDEILSFIKKFCFSVICFSTCTTVLSLVLYAKGEFFTVTTAGGEVIRQGFTENRLFGVYYSPNVCALVAVISIAAVFINFVICKKKWFTYTFLVLNFVLNFVCFSLTLSRGGAVTLSVLGVLIIILLVAPVSLEKRGVLKGAVVTVLVAALLFGGTYVGVKGVRKGMSYIPSYVSMLEQLREEETTAEETTKEEITSEETTSETESTTVLQTENPTENHTEPQTEPEETLTQVEFERIEDMSDISNGRIANWTGALKILKQSLLFGFGDYIVGESVENANYDVSELTPEELKWAFYTQGNLHNGYMQILMFSGVAGFLIFITFAVFVILKLLRIMLQGKKDTTLYKTIALLFSLLGAFAANAMIESHLLFRRQNMFSCIFWICIGVAVVLAEIYKNSDEFRAMKQKNSEDFAFVIASPLQAMNSINFVVNDIEGSKNNSDAFIYHMFNGSEELSERLKESGVFNNVYDIKEYKVYSRLVNYIITFFRMFCPKITLLLHSYERKAFGKKNYRVLCMSTTLGFTGTLHFAYPRAGIIFFEDGTGSYCNDLSKKYSKLFELLDAIFFDGEMHIYPKKIYLYRPELLTAKLEYEAEKLPDISNNEALSVIKQVFNYQQNSLYADCDLVYLTQPKDDQPGFVSDKLDEVISLIQETFGTKALARVHPRDNCDNYKMLTVDTFNNLWELECGEQISEDTILLGIFSTAQVMPKILNDKEPIIIFIYRLIFENCDDPVWQKRREFMDDFIKYYREQEHIFIPDTIDELQNILTSLKEN